MVSKEHIRQMERKKRGEVLVTESSTAEVLPSGLQVEPVKHLKRRQRSIYYRRITVKGGDMIWVQTCPLPSDAIGREYYLSKGFRLTPPEGVDFVSTNTVPEALKEPPVDRIRQAEIGRLLAEVATLKAKMVGYESQLSTEDKGKEAKPGRGRKKGGGK